MPERAKTTMTLSDAFLAALRDGFSPDFFTRDPAECETYGRDWTRVYDAAPGGVALPRTTEEVSRLLRLCSEHQVAVVPSGGRTGLAGGAVAAKGELVLSLARMRRIDAVDTVGATLRVQAGVVTEAVHQHCAPYGLTWPVDFASKGSSQVGGNIATNAGGVKVIRYGLTRQWVLGLQVVLASGEVLELNGALEKNNTGTDLRQLFIGSEGTLGVITEATLKLVRLPAALDVMLFAVPDLAAVLRVFREARASSLVVSAFEFFTDKCAARLERHRGIRPPFAESSPYYVLLEVERPEREGVLDAFLEAMTELDLITDGTLAQHATQAATLWSLREGISESLSATGLPHKNDISLPIAAVDAFTSALYGVFEQKYPGWEICLFGHIGDGNLHVNVMKPDGMEKPDFLRATKEADLVLFDLVRAHRGSISAEHGVGLLKKDYLEFTRSPAEIALLKTIKRALDPANLLNPGKIVDA
jgi:FAD/FMN-containing dehydrogenase